jgi:hypothetical protein
LLNYLKTLERRIVKPQLRRLKPSRHTIYGDIRLNYRDHLDGGGQTFGIEYMPLFHDVGMPRHSRVFEWCTGPRFIGFALLGYGFCDTLCLAGINPKAVEACRLTVTQIVGRGLTGNVRRPLGSLWMIPSEAYLPL